MSDAGCPFCAIQEQRRVAETKHFFVIRDGYPVTERHSLIIPKRHVKALYELGAEELSELTLFILKIQEQLRGEDATISGFNIGINEGASAGQTIFHLHVHIIPRRDGDTAHPRGGVRGVIPGKQSY